MKRFLIAALITLLGSVQLHPWSLEDLRGVDLTQEQLKAIITELIIQDRTEDLQKWKRVYPSSFFDLDFSRAFYESGQAFYARDQRMLALKAYLKGFVVFEESDFKTLCGYEAARILYQNYERESALFYINRVLEARIDSALREQAEKLWRRIRWEYISRHEGIPDDSISDVEFDGDDVWIGMWTGGVGRFTRSTYSLKLFRSRQDGLLSPHVRDLAMLGNYVWVGTYDGLCRYNKKYSRWENIEGKLGRAKVKRLVLIDKKLYAATLGQGVYVYHPEEDSWQLFFNKSVNVTDILKAGKDFYIATLDKGVFRVRGDEVVQVVQDIPVKALAYLSDRVWVGTYGHGIILISTRTGKAFKNIARKDGLSSDYVEALSAREGMMLIGTLGGGVTIFHEAESRFSYLNILDGLPSNDVVQITLARNRIWFGTLSGGIGILLTEDFKDF